MAVAAEEFLIKLTEQVSGAAGAANGALAKLEAQIKREQAALGGLEGKLSAASAKLAEMMEGAGKGSVSIAAIDKQRAAIAALQEQIAKQKQGIGGLEGIRGEAAALDAKAAAQKAASEAQRRADAEQKKILATMKRDQDAAAKQARLIANEEKRVASERKQALAEQKAAQAAANAETMQALGPLGGMVGSVSSVAAATGVAVGAVLALVAALVAVTGAAVAAAVALTQYAFASADAARASRLFDQAAAGGAVKGRELTMVIDQIAAKVPIARSQIEQFGRQLELAGISGRRMQVALEMIAAIESVVPGAGSKIEGLVERFQKLRRAVLTKADLEGTGLALVDVAAQLAKGMGITQAAALRMLQNGTASVDKVLDAMNKAIEQKFGKTIAAQMMGFQVQFSKLKENLAGLFADVNLESLLTGLKTITDLFSQQTVMGRVLRALFGMMFTGIANAVAKLFPAIRAFFVGFAIGALKMYIALKPLGAAISEALGGAKEGETLATVLKVATFAALAFGQVIKGAMYAIMGTITVVQFLYNAGQRLIAFFSNLPAAIGLLTAALYNLPAMAMAAGQALIQGLINGIMGGLGAVGAAVAQLGAMIEAKLREAIGWHSPATLGVDAAGAIGEGFTQEAGAQESKTSDAAGKMINPEKAKKEAKDGKGGGKWVYIENFYGSDENLAKLRAFMTGEFEFMSKA